MKTFYKKKWGLFFIIIFMFTVFAQCKSGTDTVNPSLPTDESLSPANLIAPLDLATNQSSSINLKWGKVEDAKEYIIRISESEEFTADKLNLLASAGKKVTGTNENNSQTGNRITNIDSLVTKPSFTAESLPRNTTYYWKILPISENMEGEWSDVWQFSTGEEDTDVTVELASPADEEQILVGDISFEWDPIPDSEGYHFQLDQSSDFTEVLIDSVLSSPNIEIHKLTENAQYHWQVAPILKSQTGTWAHRRSFTLTDEPPIPGVTLQSPSKESDTQPVSFTFAWKEISEIEDYQIQIATQASFSKVKHDEIVTGTSYKVSGLDHEQMYYWRVRARADNSKGSWSDIWTFATKTKEIPKVALKAPSNGNDGQPTTVTLVWKELSEAKNYQIQVAANESFSNITHKETLTETSLEIDGLDHDQTYYWRVRAKADGNNGSWSNVWAFTTEVQKQQDVPAVSLLNPNNGEENQPTTVTLAWNKASGADEYQVQVAVDEAFSDIKHKETLTETSLEITGLNHDQTYYWRVRARADGNNGAWSDARTFTTEAEDIEIPKVDLLEPDDDKENQPTSLMLTWKEASGVDEYQVQVAVDEAFSDIKHDETLSETSLEITGLDHDQTYYWRVRAAVDGNNGAWSDARTFTTEAEDIEIPKVDLLNPNNDEENQSTSLTLTWEKVSGVDEYQIQVAADESFSNVTHEETLSETSLEITGLNHDQTYYWRVRAAVDGNNGAWSDARTFTTEAEDIEIPKVDLLNPNNGEENQPTTVTLTWKEATGAEEYQIQVAADESFSNVTHEETLSETSLKVTGLDHNQTYYWRVRAGVDGNNGAWSDARTFFTEAKDIEIPKADLLEPDDGKENQPTSLTFTWKEATGAEEYQIQVAADESFSNVTHEETLSETSLEITGLDHDQTYYWRVRAGVDGNNGAWSDVRAFTTEAQNIPKVSLLDPNNGEENQPTSITFIWEEASGVDEYQVQVAADESFSNITHEETLSETSLEITGLDHDQTYYWRVRAGVDGNNGIWSDVRAFTTEAQNIPKVSLLDPFDGTDNLPRSLTLSWEEVSGAEEYLIQVAEDPSFSNRIENESTTGVSYNLSGLDQDHIYHWRVRARANGNSGEWSNVWEFRTKPETTSTPPPSGEFVSVRNGNFEVDGRTFRFAGTNAYYLPNYEKLDPGTVDKTLDAFQDAGINVVRMWAFYDGYDCGYSRKDASENVIQTAPGQYSEQALRDLDQVIAKGKQRGIRFVLTLLNYWDQLGGICQYNTWAGASDPSKNMNFFLNNNDTQKWYRDYISMLVNRVNTETGVAYKKEPAIFSWQIINEGRNSGKSPQILRDWYREIARYIKSMDSNHLVSTGEEGFDHNIPGEYTKSDYSNTYILRANEGTSYKMNTAIPEIDFGWAHWYPIEWGWRNADNSDRNKAMRAWLSDHQSIAESQGKPFVIGEYGFPGDDWRPIEALYPEFWEHAEQIGLNGNLLWQFTTANAPKCREFGGNICWPDDDAIYNKFKNHIQTIENK